MAGRAAPGRVLPLGLRFALIPAAPGHRQTRKRLPRSVGTRTAPGAHAAPELSQIHTWRHRNTRPSWAVAIKDSAKPRGLSVPAGTPLEAGSFHNGRHKTESFHQIVD